MGAEIGFGELVMAVMNNLNSLIQVLINSFLSALALVFGGSYRFFY